MPIVMPPQAPASSGAQVVPLVQIFDYVLDDSGKAIPNVRITCTLNNMTSVVVVPPLLLGTVALVTQTDSNGYFTFNVVANNNILPAGTLYIVESPFRNYDISVPSGGPYQTVSLIV